MQGGVSSYPGERLTQRAVDGAAARANLGVPGKESRPIDEVGSQNRPAANAFR